ncbi:hypothetical protein [Flavobacterium alkalisoli]|uniref:hypothetical protein n=1 Tax=Flavobacterium alkalisoli TaxID=2602769 RepID=UPI003A8EC4F2
MTREEMIKDILARQNKPSREDMINDILGRNASSIESTPSIIEAEHDDVSFLDRMNIKNFGNSNESSAKYLQQKYPHLDVMPHDGRLLIKSKDAKEWNVLDPDKDGFDGVGELLKDTGDLLYDGASGVAETLATAMAGIGTVGLGAIPANMATSAISETLRQGIGKATGVNEEIDGKDIALAGTIGGLLPVGLTGAKGLYKTGAKYAPKAMSTLSNFTEDDIKYLVRNPQNKEFLSKVADMDSSQLASELKGVAGEFANSIGNINRQAGEEIGKIRNGSDATFDLGVFKEVLDKDLDELTSISNSTDVSDKILQNRRLYNKFFAPNEVKYKGVGVEKSGDVVEAKKYLIERGKINEVFKDEVYPELKGDVFSHSSPTAMYDEAGEVIGYKQGKDLYENHYKVVGHKKVGDVERPILQELPREKMAQSQDIKVKPQTYKSHTPIDYVEKEMIDLVPKFNHVDMDGLLNVRSNLKEGFVNTGDSPISKQMKINSGTTHEQSLKQVLWNKTNELIDASLGAKDAGARERYREIMEIMTRAQKQLRNPQQIINKMKDSEKLGATMLFDDIKRLKELGAEVGVDFNLDDILTRGRVLAGAYNNKNNRALRDLFQNLGVGFMLAQGNTSYGAVKGMSAMMGFMADRYGDRGALKAIDWGTRMKPKADAIGNNLDYFAPYYQQIMRQMNRSQNND